jgi:heptosyltransferase-2
LGYFDSWFLWKPGSTKPLERTWPVVRALRRERLDLAILLPNSFRSALAAWLTGAKRCIGYGRDGRNWLLTDRLKPRKSGRGFVPTPIIDYYLELAYHLGCPREPYRMELVTSAADEQAADRVWRARGLCGAQRIVVINPGAAFGSAKCWPTSYFGELARKLGGIPGMGVLVLCGPQETSLARDIVKRAGRDTVHSLADAAVSIGLSKACVRRAQLMITTDSGPRHFAGAFGVPVVTLFGPTHIEWTETYFANAVHLQKKVPCGPCQLRECPLDHRCMKQLTPDEVFDSAMKLLNRAEAQRPRKIA